MIDNSKEFAADLFKNLQDWALAAGRQLQSKQTGYVHYHYGESQEPFHSIPILENVLFSLALLRSRLIEQVQESKVLLKGILAFQNLQEGDSYGNFPVYLHAYPVCQDPTMGLQLLAPFYWIIKQFGHVLGADLRLQIETAARLALSQTLRAYTAKPFPYFLTIRLATAQWAYGSLWNEEELLQEGKKRLMQLADHQLEGWHTTAQLADILAGLQMVYPSLLESPWQFLWKRMEETWHLQTGCYIGPCIREWQDREEPQPNLYDIYAGCFAGQFSRRAVLLRPYHLHAVLIQPSSDKFEKDRHSLIVKGSWQEQAWETLSCPSGAYTLFEVKGSDHPAKEKMRTPLRLVWGDLHRVHSLVCQGGHYEQVECVQEGDVVKIIFKLMKPSNLEERDSQREIELFSDFYPDLSLSVNEKSANTFQLGETLILSSEKHKISLVFDLLEGEGTFLGHLMRGNRPSQMSCKGERRFQAYDWTLFLRTIRRQSECRVQMTLSFSKQDMH